MKVKPNRVAHLLEASGFESNPVNQMAFVRKHGCSDLFEWLEIVAQGKQGEAVYAWVGVTVTCRIAIKGLITTRSLDEIPGNCERGWRIINTTQEAKQWEIELANIGPQIAEQFGREYGNELLARTASARRARDKYLEYLGTVMPLNKRVDELRSMADVTTARAALRLAEFPGVRQVYESEDVYELCALALLLFEREVETTPTNFRTGNPLEDYELLWRIELLADHIFMETGTAFT